MHESALAKLPTEARNPRSTKIDELSTAEMLRVINAEDAMVAAAVAAEIPRIAEAIDRLVPRMKRGGRLFYIGAGTSGRLGVLDASECPPTFSVPTTLVQGIIAGGDQALRLSSEGSEDSRAQGVADLAARGFLEVDPANGERKPDCLVGIAASGRTPYVLGALEYARSIGALTVALACVPDSEIGRVAEIAIAPATGAEVLTGSTRMKAGSATKLVLNMLSTGIMIRMGATYSNLMVNVRPTNAKLVDRERRILIAATANDSLPVLTAEAAGALLAEAGSLKTAILMHTLELDRASAEARLLEAKGVLRNALVE